ncbi:hypothetical protein BX600DRAFT_511927 [Xylariales sp. PMI_506]|nr:hypothetical protein BX600DRAFT_511927 [Xylariales sp. PMI_506]
MTTQILKRISIRWLPDAAYEDTDTIALNVGGYFIDLRVQKNDGNIQWSRAGERSILKEDPLTCRWTHIIDSLGLTEPDVASFRKLPNGDDLEYGTYKNPNLGGALTEYEEIWRDVTGVLDTSECSWILQSVDGSTFVGKIGGTYLGIRLGGDGRFDARREERAESAEDWKVIFESANAQTIPQASATTLLLAAQAQQKLETGDIVELEGVSYTVRAQEKKTQ